MFSARVSVKRLMILKSIPSACLLPLLLFFSSSFVYSQTGIIKGSIVNSKTQEPLTGATITIEGTSYGAAADSEGSFLIGNIPSGIYQVTGSYLSYETLTKEGVAVRAGDTTTIEMALAPEGISLKAVEITAKPNREAEHIQLAEQRKSLTAIQQVGAHELSRKGIGDAETAVSKVSGISKQEGVKNVFVRGLGDRYNTTLLNGMPVPSEDPEYKNIALAFFGTDIIQHIGVNKVFSAGNGGDVGGAIIDITSKELINDRSFGLEISEGFNTRANGTTFLRPSGSDYFGFTRSSRPASGKFDFPNSLDPSVIKLPVNQSFRISGGKQFKLGENPLSLFVVATHATDNSYTEETVRNMNTAGMIYQDQTGKKYSGKTNQLVLANLNYNISRSYSIAYNFMMLHANNQYVGEYRGKHAEKHQDGDSDMGYLRRQQINDNLLTTHQLLSKWNWTERLNLVTDISFNSIKGLEPDRRENYLSKKSDGSYGLTGSNRQKRFFSELNEKNYNAKLAFNYQLRDAYESNNSRLTLGYNGHISENDFEAAEYNFSAVPGSYSIDNIVLDDLYNTSNYSKRIFSMAEGNPNSYAVAKNIHSVYAESAYQLAAALTGSIGIRFDYVNMRVDYDVPGRADNSNSIVKPYYLPGLNLKYDLNDKNALRLGASKTYTLPQSKEISPYQYVNIGFASEGNPDIRPSDNYNIDLKWDNYLSTSELLSVAVFYKRIINPIGRVDKGNSAGLLTYDNISRFADVTGVEVEVRKNIFSRTNTSHSNKLSFGLNASFLHTSLVLDLTNTPERKSGLEGASPFIFNTDITYYYSKKGKRLVSSVVFSYFSDRIYTNGTLGFHDMTEAGVPTLDFVSSFKFNKKFGLKLKATNLLDPSFSLMRKSNASNEKIILNQYKKGIGLSLGASFDL